MSTEIERNPVTAFQIAASFLTRFPMGHGGRHYHRPLAASVWIFAIVGALVGFCGALIFCAGIWIGFPVWLTALASVAGMYFFTGGLHEDGLADVADGFWGGSNKEQKLRIMRDSRVGSYGVTALTFSIFARTAVLASLPSASIAAVAMIAAGALSRGAIGIPMVALPTARVDGLSVSAGKPGYMHALSGLGVAFLIVWVSVGFWDGSIAIFVSGIAMVLVLLLAKLHINGQTGDVLGAVVQVIEITFLAVLSIS